MKNCDTAALRQLWQEAFGDDDAFLDAFFSTAFSPDRCRVIEEDGRLKAALYWFDCSFQGKKIAYLYAVATAKSARRQGLCRALVEQTHAHLKDNGYAGAVLVPGEENLFELYRKLGYETCGYITEFSCKSLPSDLMLERIEAEEYAALRRKMLEETAVLQEGENLAFLHTQFSLFRGDNLLLAARREDDALFCAELLGDPAAAPGILTALGCEYGTFRIPGRMRPFAMYHALSDLPAPGYFGLAFD